MRRDYRWIAAPALMLVLTIALGAAPSAAVGVLYSGTFVQIIRTGVSPQVPPAQTLPQFGGVLSVTPGGGIQIDPGDANFVSSFVVSNPPTFAGVLQQSDFISLMNPVPGTAAPGNGPGPLSFAFPSPTGSPPVNPTFGATRRLGAVSMAGGGQNFGGSLGLLFNFTSQLVLFGGGGGAPNLACPIGLQGAFGDSFVATDLATCVAITTGPLPAMTLPSITVPRFVSVTGWPATTRTVFAAAPAPLTTTTVTAVGSDVRNTAGTTGMIQLVAPWVFSSQNGLPSGPSGQNHGAGVARISLSLLPEPDGVLVLLGGIASIVSLRVLEHRRGRPRTPASPR